MSKSLTTRLAALTFALTLPLAAMAQETATPAENDAGSAATEFSAGQEVGADDELGQTYTQEAAGDWEVRCIKTADGFDPCQLYQLLKDQNGNAVAEISMVSLPDGQEAAAGATVITPLETLLTQQVTLTVDGSKAKRYPFTWCDRVGCFSRIGFTKAEVDQLKRGAKATMVIVPMIAPNEKVTLSVSLIGFTAGLDRVTALNNETAARANAAAAAATPETTEAPKE